LAKVRFDIAIPDLRLVIEYNGPHHYSKTYLQVDVATYTAKDEVKRQLCQLNNFTLLVVCLGDDLVKEGVTDGRRSFVGSLLVE